VKPLDPVAVALDRRRPFRVLPTLQPALIAYEHAIAETGDVHALRRLRSYRAMVGRAIEKGSITSATWHREPSGRIRLDKPSLQQVANALRIHFAPSREGYAFFDADYKCAHLAIAAARSRDPTLLAIVGSGQDVYAEIARVVLPTVPDRALARKVAKVCALALLNGGDTKTVSRLLATVVPLEVARAAAPLVFVGWWTSFPKLRAFRDAAKTADHERPAGQHVVQTLTGRSVSIDMSKRKGGWRTLLSIAWTSVESEAMDYVLERLHGTIGVFGGALVLPMYDGVLVEAPERAAKSIQVRLTGLMKRAMEASGVPGVGVDVEMRSCWGEEKPAVAAATTGAPLDPWGALPNP